MSTPRPCNPWSVIHGSHTRVSSVALPFRRSLDTKTQPPGATGPLESLHSTLSLSLKTARRLAKLLKNESSYVERTKEMGREGLTVKCGGLPEHKHACMPRTSNEILEEGAKAAVSLCKLIRGALLEAREFEKKHGSLASRFEAALSSIGALKAQLEVHREGKVCGIHPHQSRGASSSHSSTSLSKGSSRCKGNGASFMMVSDEESLTLDPSANPNKRNCPDLPGEADDGDQALLEVKGGLAGGNRLALMRGKAVGNRGI
ncbi:unnamed protein product, partial [Discosporangium mesarthrocarpum]